MEIAVRLFEHHVGKPPRAYRAGGYRIADPHFPILEEFGIRFDSSVQAYYNSNVSDWMRTRTQPYWVGQVLEVPPTLVLLNDNPDAWSARGFQPNAELGDPIARLPSDPEGVPRVVTYVSHSFQLLKARRFTDTAVVSAFRRRLGRVVDSQIVDQFIPRLESQGVLTYGEEIDEALVTPVAGLLRRLADRPDAYCATFEELERVVDCGWLQRHDVRIDPMPLHDRRKAVSKVTWLRRHEATTEPAGTGYGASSRRRRAEQLADPSGLCGDPDKPSDSGSLRLEFTNEGGSFEIFIGCIDSERVAYLANTLFSVLGVGAEFQLELEPSSDLETRIATLEEFMEAGLECVDVQTERKRISYEFVKPLEVSDLRRFAGLH